MATLIKLLALFAVLLMPFGMAPAAAAAHDSMAMNMPMGHCPEQAPKHDTKGGIAECTMACAGALPAAELATAGPPMIVCEPLQPAAVQQLHGLHPETATPPPKRS
jgi:hypothetical protein